MKKFAFYFLICVSIFVNQSFAQAPVNDDPCNAISLTVGINCNYTQYTTANATATAGVPNPGCANYSGADVWFNAVVPANGIIIFDSNTGAITDGGMALYAGACGSLTLVACDDDGSIHGLMPSISQTGLTPGTTVFLRFWGYGVNNTGTFSICAKKGESCSFSSSNNSCAEADPICLSTSIDYCGTTNTPSLGGGGIYGCLFSTPNPAFYFLNVETSGPIIFNISQQTISGVLIDVDYVLWGPFASTASMCSGLASTNIVSCSYSTAGVETATIPNGIAGEYYMLLITNYSNQVGIINFTQTNAGLSGAGTSNCNYITASTGLCSGGNYTLNGTINTLNPPTTGTLTLTNSCGGSHVYNAPFSNAINFTQSNICGNGNGCTISAVYSAPGAPIVLPTTYNAPSCNTLTAIAGACVSGVYVLSGTLTTGCLPSSGTLTISSSCGGSTVYNAPFSNPFNWSLPASTGNGGACTITAVYSASGAPIITPIVITEPTCCPANAGTITVTQTNGTQTLLGNGTTQVVLCQGGSVNLVSDNNYTLPSSGCVSCVPELIYVIYTSDGPTGPDPTLDSNWTGYYWTGQDFTTANGGGYNVNNSGSCSPLLNIPTFPPYASTSSPTNTLVFVPITADDGDNDAGSTLAHDQNGDGCFDIGNPISITFLNPISFNPITSCNGTVTVEITGGYPEFFPALFTLTNTGAGTLSSTSVTSGGNVVITGLSAGQNYSFDVNDGNGCTQTFSGVYFGQPLLSITPTSSSICTAGNCVNLTSTLTAGESIYTNSRCETIADGGIATNCDTGPTTCTGTWITSVISVSGFCGTTWSTGDELIACLNINHTFDSDLNIFLQSPNGVYVKLSDDNGAGLDNYTNTCFTMSAATNITAGLAPFTGSFIPEENFNAFNGTNVNGNWTLWIADDATGDFGNLLNWSLTFSNQNNFTYSWSPSTGLSATNIANPVACPNAPTTYTLTATNSCGCSASATSAIVIGGCPIPTNISVSNIGGSSATVSWVGNSCAVKYRVQYRKQGTTAWTTKTVAAPITTKTLTGLSELTTYEYKVRSDCNASGTNASAFSSIQIFTTSCLCAKPTNISTTANSQTSVTVNWNGNVCAYQYRLQYRKQGTTAWTTKLILAPVVTKTLTGLIANSIYEYRIRTDCNSGGTINSGFTTIQTFSTPLRVEEENNLSADINLYPNPTDGTINISSTVAIDKIECFNSLGQLVFQKSFQNQIDLNEYANGNYLIKLDYENGKEYKVYKVLLVK